MLINTLQCVCLLFATIVFGKYSSNYLNYVEWQVKYFIYLIFTSNSSFQNKDLWCRKQTLTIYHSYQVIKKICQNRSIVNTYLSRAKRKRIWEIEAAEGLQKLRNKIHKETIISRWLMSLTTQVVKRKGGKT